MTRKQGPERWSTPPPSSSIKLLRSNTDQPGKPGSIPGTDKTFHSLSLSLSESEDSHTLSDFGKSYNFPIKNYFRVKSPSNIDKLLSSLLYSLDS